MRSGRWSPRSRPSSPPPRSTCRLEGGRSHPLSYEGNWSAWVDLNHRSPASKAGGDGQTPLHAGLGAHGRTRTCTFLIRSQGLYPVELRVRDWCRDGDSNSGLPVESRRVLATTRSRRIGSPTRTRTWIDRLTTGRPTVGRSGNGGAPRTRTELNLLAREIRGPCACPDWVCLGGQTLLLRVHGAMARWV